MEGTMNPLFVNRIDCLLARDWTGTVSDFQNDPDKLASSVWETVIRADRYKQQLKDHGDLGRFEIDELLSNFIAPTDAPCMNPPDMELYERIIEWAERESESPPGKDGAGG
jgi:hypothetical protein